MMYLEINEETKQKMEDIIGVICEARGDLLPHNIIETLFEDLIYEYHNLKEEYEDFKQDVEDNYEPVPISKQLGIDDRDFYDF